MRPAYAIFRRSIFAYLHRNGMATADEAADPPIESSWLRQSDWIQHLWSTAAENWVAIDASGKLVGWALSVTRGGHLELAFFFVEPGSSARGLGRRLLELAFSGRPETSRTIIATQDPAALSLYLRAGVNFTGTSVDICVRGQPRSVSTDLRFRPLRQVADDIETVCRIERRLIGLHRPEDIGFLLGNRPGWSAERAGQTVGYAFGAQPLPDGATDFPPTIGPAGALDDADIPALIDHIIDSADIGTDLYFGVPMVNRRAIGHLLELGGRIDPFYLAVLSTDQGMRLDRYVHTAPSFII